MPMQRNVVLLIVSRKASNTESITLQVKSYDSNYVICTC